MDGTRTSRGTKFLDLISRNTGLTSIGEVHVYNYRTYKCPDCNAEFDQPGYVDNEWRTVNKAVEEKYTGYCCPFCMSAMKGIK